MKKAEFILGALVLVGLLLKYFKIPFGGAILVISTTFLAVLYYPLGFILLNGIRSRDLFRSTAFKNTNWKSILVPLVVGFALAVALIGILFKVQIWPSGDFILGVGLILCFLRSTLSIFFLLKKQSVFAKRVLLRTGLLTGLGLSLFLISDDTLIDHFFAERSKEYRETMKQLQENSGNRDLQNKLMKLDKQHYESTGN